METPLPGVSIPGFQIFLHPSDAGGKSAGKPFLLSAASCLRKNGSSGRQSRPCGMTQREHPLQSCNYLSFRGRCAAKGQRVTGKNLPASNNRSSTATSFRIRYRGAACVKSNMEYSLCKYMVYTFTPGAGAPQAKRGAPGISSGIEDPSINRYIVPNPALAFPSRGRCLRSRRMRFWRSGTFSVFCISVTWIPTISSLFTLRSSLWQAT